MKAFFFKKKKVFLLSAVFINCVAFSLRSLQQKEMPLNSTTETDRLCNAYCRMKARFSSKVVHECKRVSATTYVWESEEKLKGQYSPSPLGKTESLADRCCTHKLASLGLPQIHLPLPPSSGEERWDGRIWFHMGSSYPKEETHILSKFSSHWALSSAPKEALLFFSKYFITCVCVDTPLPRSAHRVQRTTLWRWLSLSTFVCVPGIELRLSGLPAKHFNLWVISLALLLFFLCYMYNASLVLKKWGNENQATSIQLLVLLIMGPS